MSPLRSLSRWQPWQIDAGAVTLLAVLAAGVYWIEAAVSLDRYDAVLAMKQDLDGRYSKTRDIETAMIAIRQRTDAANRLIAEAGFTLDAASRINARLARITDAAASTGLQVEAIEPSKAVASGRLAAITIRVTAKGRYAGVVTFAHELRDRMPDCAITALELTAAPAVADPVANINIQITWHATPDNPVASN